MRYQFHNASLAALATVAARLDARMDYFSRSGPGEMDTNFVPVRNVFPGAGGGTLATLGAAGSPDSYGQNYSGAVDSAADPAPSVDTPATPGIGGLTWWVGIAVLLGLLLFAAKKTGQAGEFSNLRISTYNVLFITLTTVLGLTGLKVIAVKTKDVPVLKGFSQVVLAA